jgi:hypothetical protein
VLASRQGSTRDRSAGPQPQRRQRRGSHGDDEPGPGRACELQQVSSSGSRSASESRP